MLSALYGSIALVFVLGGVVCAYDARSYTDEQKARAPRLVRAYFGSGLLLSVVGLTSLAWMLAGGSVWTAGILLPAVSALPGLVQYRLHQQLAIDRSPLTDRLSSSVARKLNYSDP
ncbi:hypothetical protein [Natronorubrum tibetense]|uniref:Uncharacterized protein n=1 Tax=Natronorubrum tibetense GA33 TaxID=1114856 RepID=L9VQH0_9EURY|nr:hypothetical protein [Natronorubrum tibetense]ELY39227.1 hypothetical protein C496_15257 [Natronorubrum tibetense GA33]